MKLYKVEFGIWGGYRGFDLFVANSFKEAEEKALNSGKGRNIEGKEDDEGFEYAHVNCAFNVFDGKLICFDNKYHVKVRKYNKVDIFFCKLRNKYRAYKFNKKWRKCNG